MFRLPALSALSRRPLSPWQRAALFGAGLLVLWLALQLAPSPAAAVAEARSAEVAGRLPARGGAARDAAAFGAAPAAARPAPPPQRGLLSVGNVAAFALLAGGVAWAVVLRRRAPAGGADGPAPALRPLGELALAPGPSLRLVAVGDEVLLVGVAQGGVSLLRRYAADEAPVAPTAAPPASFADLLRHAQVGPAPRG